MYPLKRGMVSLFNTGKAHTGSTVRPNLFVCLAA
jgi:hypothetical protein